MGGVQIIEEVCRLYRPGNERDYGKEAIEILFQVMENNRDGFVVIPVGDVDRMDRLFERNPSVRSRIAHHLEVPDHGDEALLEIAGLVLDEQNHRLTDEASTALRETVALRHAA